MVYIIYIFVVPQGYPQVLSSTMADYYLRREAMRTDQGERADGAMEQYFELIIYVYQQKLIGTFGDYEAELLYDRTYLQFSSLWLCRNVIDLFKHWFSAHIEDFDEEDVGKKWLLLADVIDDSIDNMIAFLAAVKDAHGKRDWLTAREGLEKAYEVFVAATGNPPYNEDTFLVWDMINHREFQCVSTTTLFVFIEEILGEWDKVRVGSQHLHAYIDGIAEIYANTDIPWVPHTPICMVRHLFETDEGKEDVHSSYRWSFFSMQNLKFHLAYEGQSAFVFFDSIPSLHERLDQMEENDVKYYNIDYLTEDEEIRSYFIYNIAYVLRGGSMWRPLHIGILPADFEGANEEGYVASAEMAILAAHHVIEQSPLMTHLNGRYGNTNLATEHAYYLYYNHITTFFKMDIDEKYDFQNWVLQQQDANYLRLFVAILIRDITPIPVEMYIPCATHLPFYYWNKFYILKGIAGMLHEEYERDTIPTLLYTIPLPLAVQILHMWKRMMGGTLTAEDVWTLFTGSDDPIVPTTMMATMPQQGIEEPIWQHDGFEKHPPEYVLFRVSVLYHYLGQCYAKGTALVDDQWIASDSMFRKNPVYFTDIHKKTLSPESIAAYAKYSLWFSGNMEIDPSVREMFMQDVGARGDLQNELQTVIDRADLPPAMVEMSRKLMGMRSLPNVPDARRARGWHPYIYGLYLSKKTESNLLMLTILLFILQDSHPYFLEFMGVTKEEYISHKNKKVDLAIERRLQEEELQSLDDMSMWDALQQFIE